MTPAQDLDRNRLARVLGPAEPELTCEECFESLDRYVELELAGDGDGVERTPIGGGEDLRVHDVRASNGTSASDDREQPGMVRGEYRELGYAARSRERNRGRERLSGLCGRAQELRMRDLVR